ncbi:energy transducer TonB [Sphingopyxis terrae]|uniref:energy transducer TonB n=1 Tax=Sphingopyxis terrae TaxID=33052 RepID=UPI002A0B9239|nr:energy transducer TonB [Sphingopyxis terrae]MDX8357207.1 energy transducer TonB [Sphingopyxis terrae]
MERVTYRSSSVVAVAMLSLLMAPNAGAKPKEPLHLQPSSKWLLNYADDSCRLARQFGEGDDKVMLVMDRFEPGDGMRMSFFGKPARTSRMDGDAKIRFGPDQAEQEIGFYPGRGDGKTPALVLRSEVRIAPRSEAENATRDAGDFGFRWSMVTPAEEAAVTWIEVGSPVSRPFVLETGSMGNAFAALSKCTDELLDHWGIDVARHATMTRPVTPISDPGQWIRSGDYPQEMLWQGQRALVQFRLNVDASGKPTACHIQQTTRAKEFDDAVCKSIMRRAEFKPALDADGKPMASYWLSSVNFHMGL